MMTCKGFAFLYVAMTCTPVHTPPSDTYCRITKPLHYEKSTPAATKRRIQIHNRQYRALCLQAKP
jgi:hypothetical protein